MITLREAIKRGVDMAPTPEKIPEFVERSVVHYLANKFSPAILEGGKAVKKLWTEITGRKL